MSRRCIPTPMQRAMLLATLRQPECGWYIQQIFLEGKTFLGLAEKVCEAWRKLRRRWSALRMRVVREKGMPGGIGLEFPEDEEIEGDSFFEIKRINRSKIGEFLRADRSRGFALEGGGLLWRVTFLEVENGEPAIVWTFHHALLDGWSHGKLVEDFLGHLDGRESPVKDNEVDFPNYLEWYSGLDFTGAEKFFAERYKRAREMRSWMSEVEIRGGGERELCFELEMRDMQRLEAFAEAVGVTLHTLCQAAWGLVLAEHGGGDVAVFGSVRACRHWPRGEIFAPGCYINTVPFLVEVEREIGLLDWLKGVRELQVELRQWERVSYSQARQWLGFPSELALASSTVLVFDDRPLERVIQRAGERWREVKVRFLEKTKEMVLSVRVGERLRAELEVAEWANRALSERLLGHFRAALLSMGELISKKRTSESKVADILLLDEKDVELIAQAKNFRGAPGSRTFVQWLEGVFAQYAERIALEFEERAIRYSDLFDISLRLGKVLREEFGVCQGDRVIVFVGREPELVIGEVAVWLLGGVVVPVDALAPVERVRQIVADSGAKVVLCSEQSREILPEVGLPVWVISKEIGGEEKPCRRLEESSNEGAGVALLYTSGSTGVPKGVILTQLGLANFCQYLRESLHLRDGERVAAVSSPSFDASLLDIMLAFCCGGVLVFGRWDEVSSGQRLGEFLRRQEISTVFLTPTFLREVQGELPAMRNLLVGGEVVTRELAERWACRCAVWNIYGPTETTIYALTEVIPAEEQGKPALGRPFPNAWVVVVDGRGRLCPVGVVGELWIGGLGVGAGYWRDEKLTSERFLEWDFEQVKSGQKHRFYRTGDLGRLLPDGRFEFLGRRDFQVKIRGVRVELEEIESAILSFSGVQHAAVILRGEELIGFVSPAVSEKGLRRHLAESLEFFLIPQRFVFLENLPRTVSGKVNREELKRWKAEKKIYISKKAEGEVFSSDLSDVWGERMELGYEDVAVKILGDVERDAELSRRIAVREGERHLTFGDLAEGAIKVSAWLCAELGHGGELVGIYGFASPEFCILALGVMASGRGYLPLDGGLPVERVKRILQRAGAGVIFVDARLAANGESLSGLGRAVIFDERLDFCQGADGKVEIGGDYAGRPAYVIFTSGSTGEPKGVAIRRRSLANLCQHYAHRLGLGREDWGSMLASISFDASVADLWPYLAVGAGVVVPSVEAKKNARVLRNWLIEAGVTRSFLPTALGEVVFGMRWPREVALRDMLVGGDRLGMYPPEGLPFRVWNTYGPTETTVDALWYELPRDGRREPPPIGLPIANYRALVCGEGGEVLARGEEGELWIGGEGVAIGYWRDEELTAGQFVKRSGEEGRFYRTGDRVRMKEDGVIEFLGRMDRQVQVRGFRVEPQEVESVMMRMGGVREAYVGVRRVGRREVFVGYYSVEEGVEVDSRVLRDFLLCELPEFMVPAVLMRVEEMPRNHAGKVEVERLPEPRRAGAEGEEELTQMEKELVGIASELLGGPIGVEENFFEAGGDSLLVLTLLLRVEERLGVRLSALRFLQRPTIRHLAEMVEGVRRRAGDSPSAVDGVRSAVLIPVREGQELAPIFCVCPASWFRNVAKHLAEGRGFYALEILGLGEEVLAEPRVEVIGEKLAEEVDRFWRRGVCLLGGYSSNGMAVLEVAKWLRGRGRELGPVFLFDVPAPWILRAGRVRQLVWRVENFLRRPVLEQWEAMRRRIWGGSKEREEVEGIKQARRELERYVGFSRKLHGSAGRYAGAPRDLRVIFFKSSRTPSVFPNLRDFGWGGHFRELRVYEVDGDHRSFLERGEEIARRMEEELRSSGIGFLG